MIKQSQHTLFLAFNCSRLVTIQRHISPTSALGRRNLPLMSTSTAGLSTTALLDRLQGVLNARDLATATSRIAPGRIFRSGNPANGSLEDVKTLRKSLGVQQMIDFRSAEEQMEDKGWSLMLSNGVIKSYDWNGTLTQVSVDHDAQLAGIELPECELHRLALLERDRFIKALMWRLPWFTVAQAAVYKALGWEDQMRDVLVPAINGGGLPLVYKILMDTATADICRSLEFILAGAEAQTPQLIFCKLGKDRTGLISALVLAACGAADEEIVADYAKSDGVDQIALGGLEKMRDMKGMDPKLFARAPAEAMAEMLRYADEQYGGFSRYMEQIGFGQAKQERLAFALGDRETQ